MPTRANLLIVTGTAMSLALFGGVALTTPASAEDVSVDSVTPAVVGANAATTVRIKGSGFTPDDAVTIRNCPASNPTAVYRVRPRLPTSRKRAVDGIWFVRSTGVIKGTPTRIAARTTYRISAISDPERETVAKIRLHIPRPSR